MYRHRPFKHNKTFVILLNGLVGCAGHLEGEERGNKTRFRRRRQGVALMRRPGIRAGSFLFLPLAFLIIPPQAIARPPDV